eukprot:2574759-Alexandrium_andersonii.AAC.1
MPRCGAPSRSLGAPSPIARRPGGGGSEEAPVSLCGGDPFSRPPGESGAAARTDVTRRAPP